MRINYHINIQLTLIASSECYNMREMYEEVAETLAEDRASVTVAAVDVENGKTQISLL